MIVLFIFTSCTITETCFCNYLPKKASGQSLFRHSPEAFPSIYMINLKTNHHSNEMYHKRTQPCDHTLPDHHTGCPFSAKFSLYRGNCRYTWSIQQTEYQERCGGQRCQHCLKAGCTSKQHRQCGNDTFFRHKSGNQRCRNSSVSKTKRCKYRSNHPRNHCQNTFL